MPTLTPSPNPALTTSLPALTTNSVTGPELTVSAVLTGTAAAGHTLREVGVFAADGTLMGRRVLAPKAFEPDTGFELDIIFEY